MSGPIVCARLWRAVMTAAGGRCQCEGRCGNAHKKGKGRCTHEHGKYASKHRGPIRLIAAPVDPALNTLAAARLPASDLRAWCPACFDQARRAARKTASAPSLAQPGLFDLEDS